MPMYQISRIVPKFDIELPKCMYTVKTHSQIDLDDKTDVSDSSHISREIKRQIENILKKSPEMAALEKRQEKVFQQLEELKQLLLGMRASLNLCQKPGPQSDANENKKLKKESKSFPKQKASEVDTTVYDTLPDIVINANPDYIPYGLLAVKHIWKDLFTINVTVHSHSTIPNLNQEALDFQTEIAKPSEANTKGGINVTLIWKNCQYTEMISSPTMYIPIYGEVNILRYLARVGPKFYRYEETNLSNEADIVMDICYQLLRCNTSKVCLNLLRELSSRLQKEGFYGGDKLNVADIAVCSTLKRMPKLQKDLPGSMKKWHARVKPITLM